MISARQTPPSFHRKRSDFYRNKLAFHFSVDPSLILSFIHYYTSSLSLSTLFLLTYFFLFRLSFNSSSSSSLFPPLPVSSLYCSLRMMKNSPCNSEETDPKTGLLYPPLPPQFYWKYALAKTQAIASYTFWYSKNPFEGSFVATSCANVYYYTAAPEIQWRRRGQRKTWIINKNESQPKESC